MSASQHTPGPWKVVNDWNGRPVKITAPHADPHKPGGIVDITRDRAISLPSSGEGKANARLIAAAPELLEAADRLTLLCHTTGKPADGFRFRELVLELRKAIAKAKGR